MTDVILQSNVVQSNVNTSQVAVSLVTEALNVTLNDNVLGVLLSPVTIDVVVTTTVINVTVQQSNVTQSIIGIPGAPGADGAKWFVGVGVPDDETGSDGDFYLNGFNGDVYGPKASGAWGAVAGNITGPAGATGPQGAAGEDGSIWHNGAGAPDNGLGADGDYYLDNDSGDYYQKTAGDWGEKLGTFFPPGPRGATITRDEETGQITSMLLTDNTTITITREDGYISAASRDGFTWSFTRNDDGYIENVDVSED